MIGERFAKSSHSKTPSSGFCNGFLKFFPDAILCHIMSPTFATSTTLVTKSTDIVSFVSKEIAESWNIHSVGAASSIVFVFVSVNGSTGPYSQVVIHQVMPQFAAAASQSVRP